MDIIIQGNLYDCTYELINNLLSTSFVNKIIVSTWEGDTLAMSDPDIVKITSSDVAHPGVGNRNRQIVSTRIGLAWVTTPVCAKFRSDQLFPDQTLEEMNDFYKKHSNGTKIFTLGLYKNWPFHPRDHIFWGPTSRVKELFDCPLDPYKGEIDYTKCLRAEAWIGAHYFARYDPIVDLFLSNQRTYLTDEAPLRDQAFLIDEQLKHHLFHPFPRLAYSWPKLGLEDYYYDYTSAEWSEYWHEDIYATK